MGARVEILNSSSDVLKKYLSDTAVQRYAEDALSKKVTSELTNLHKEFLTVAKARDTFQGKAIELGTMASEQFTAGMQRLDFGGDRSDASFIQSKQEALQQRV